MILPVQAGMAADEKSELMIDQQQTKPPVGVGWYFLKDESLLCRFHISGWEMHSYAGFVPTSNEPSVTYFWSSFPF
jgi:hypothetical protein